VVAFFWHENAAQNHREKSPQCLARGRKYFLRRTLFIAWKKCLLRKSPDCAALDRRRISAILREKWLSISRIKRRGVDFLGKTARVKSLFDHTQENAAASAVLESCLRVSIHCRPVRCVNGQHELLVRRHSSG